MTMFIRYGAWCGKCRASLAYAGDGAQVGLAVYECEAVGPGAWKVIGEAWAKDARYLAEGRGPWLLLEGRARDVGPDGEPLLDEAFVFRGRLEPDPARPDVFCASEGDEPPCKDHDGCEGGVHLNVRVFVTREGPPSSAPLDRAALS